MMRHDSSSAAQQPTSPSKGSSRLHSSVSGSGHYLPSHLSSSSQSMSHNAMGQTRGQPPVPRLHSDPMHGYQQQFLAARHAQQGMQGQHESLPNAQLDAAQLQALLLQAVGAQGAQGMHAGPYAQPTPAAAGAMPPAWALQQAMVQRMQQEQVRAR